jgi:hypothetical protein
MSNENKLPTLIEISNNLQNFNMMIEANAGEITDEQCAELALMNLQSEEKVYNYCSMFDRIEFEIAFAKEQKKKLDAYIASLEKSQTWLEKIARMVIAQRGTKLIGKMGRWIGVRSSTKVEIFDKDIIPPVFLKIKVEVDNAGVKEALKRGDSVAGAKLVENENINWK